MGDSSNSLGKSSDQDDIIELVGKVTVVAIIFLFFVVIFCCCLHLYFKWFYLNRQPTTTIRRRRRRLDFAAGDEEMVMTPSSSIGLEPSVLKSIAIVTFKSDEFKDGLECAVCLCEICEGEKARILPKCNHGFHVECIDMWFHSHATCPLCRNPIPNQKISNSESTVDDQDHSSSEGPNLPTNVLFWGDENQVNAFGPCVEEDHLASPPAQPSTSATTTTSGSPDGMVVININLQSGQETDDLCAEIERAQI